jgi:hypothetical protein
MTKSFQQKIHLSSSQASALAFLFVVYVLYNYNSVLWPSSVPPHVALQVSRCRALNKPPGPPPDFHKRTKSDRFAPGTRPTLLKNAKIWTGARNGSEVIHGDILLDKGLIQNIGHFNEASLRLKIGHDLVVMDVKGAWVTPGIVDMHSHLGDASSPALKGASYDDNSLRGPVQPWLRCLDGLNTHDDSYALSVAGGITTALILPGSADAVCKASLCSIFKNLKIHKSDWRTRFYNQTSQNRTKDTNLHASRTSTPHQHIFS